MKPADLLAALRTACRTDDGRAAVDQWAERRPIAEDDGKALLMPEVVDGRLRLMLHCPLGPAQWCASVSDFAAAWRGREQLPTDIFCDSPGGDILTCRGINRLIAERRAETVFNVDGLAASAATLLATACDRRVATRGSRVLVHEAWTLAVGNKRELRREADDLEAFDSEIAEDYARIGKLDATAFAALMEEERLLTPAEALEHGLIDAVTGEDAGTKNVNALLPVYVQHLVNMGKQA